MARQKRGKNRLCRRDLNHDYYSPFIYHIILDKNPDCERFGEVEGDARIPPLNPGCARIAYSSLGRIIKETIRNFACRFPNVKVLQYSVMPDHIHILWQLLKRSENHLGDYVRSLKKSIFQQYSEAAGRELPHGYIFEEGYCDKPLYRKRSLNGLFKYIRENPHRLAMRIQFPMFFQRARGIEIGGKKYEAYGNLFLLRNPDMMQVQIHRNRTEEWLQNYRKISLHAAMKGTVMVSPFISREEKNIRSMVEEANGLQILIRHEAFGERFKPAKHDFDLCSKGRLLIISLGKDPKTAPTRQDCLEMNALARLLASQSDLVK